MYIELLKYQQNIFDLCIHSPSDKLPLTYLDPTWAAGEPA